MSGGNREMKIGDRIWKLRNSESRELVGVYLSEELARSEKTHFEDEWWLRAGHRVEYEVEEVKRVA